MAKAQFSTIRTFIAALEDSSAFPLFNFRAKVAAVVYGIVWVLMHSKGTASIANAFGEAALRNTGTSPGDVVLLATGGKIPATLLPDGLRSSGWTSAEVQEPDIVGDRNAGGIRGLSMDTSASTVTQSRPRLVISRGDLADPSPAVPRPTVPFSGEVSVTGLPDTVTVPLDDCVRVPFQVNPPNVETQVVNVTE